MASVITRSSARHTISSANGLRGDRPARRDGARRGAPAMATPRSRRGHFSKVLRPLWSARCSNVHGTRHREPAVPPHADAESRHSTTQPSTSCSRPLRPVHTDQTGRQPTCARRNARVDSSDSQLDADGFIGHVFKTIGNHVSAAVRRQVAGVWHQGSPWRLFAGLEINAESGFSTSAIDRRACHRSFQTYTDRASRFAALRGKAAALEADLVGTRDESQRTPVIVQAILERGSHAVKTVAGARLTFSGVRSNDSTAHHDGFLPSDCDRIGTIARGPAHEPRPAVETSRDLLHDHP